MHDTSFSPRVRDITDAMGSRLRLSMEPHACGALVVIEQPDARGRPRATFDGYGAEVLTGYILAARLALPQGLPDEGIGGAFPSRLRLSHTPAVALVVTQADLERPFAISATFWDRLYAELCILVAHARELGRRGCATDAGWFGMPAAMPVPVE